MVDLTSYIRKGSRPEAVIGQRTAREREHESHLANSPHNIARHGSRPKTALDRVPVHPGMHTSIRGDADIKHLVGITETTYKNYPDASGATPLDPTGSKSYTRPEPVVGHRSRTHNNETAVRLPGVSHTSRRADAIDHERGQRILEEGVAALRTDKKGGV